MFADKEFHEQLTELGADIIGDADVLKQIAAGEINFDKIVTTPEHMIDLKQMARILGPKGLMPNVKSGNLVKPDDLIETVKSSKMGLIEYRVNENSFIMGKFGKRNFKPEDLEKNLMAFLESIKGRRPESVKGRYMSSAHIKTSMGPPVKMSIDMFKDWIVWFYISLFNNL